MDGHERVWKCDERGGDSLPKDAESLSECLIREFHHRQFCKPFQIRRKKNSRDESKEGGELFEVASAESLRESHKVTVSPHPSRIEREIGYVFGEDIDEGRGGRRV